MQADVWELLDKDISMMDQTGSVWIKEPVESSKFSNPQRWEETKMGVGGPEVECSKNEVNKNFSLKKKLGNMSTG